jgi:hypothetical protein
MNRPNRSPLPPDPPELIAAPAPGALTLESLARLPRWRG